MIDSMLPNINISHEIVEKFFANTLDPNEFKAIDPMIIRDLKKERYVPADEGEVPLEDLEYLLSFSGRELVNSGKEINQVYRKYGNKDSLRKVFNDQIGYTDQESLMKIKDIARETAQKIGGEYVEGEIVVIDDQGENGTIRAYTWPYVGVGENLKAKISSQTEDQIKTDLAKENIKPWRAGRLKLTPHSDGSLATICIFIGK